LISDQLVGVAGRNERENLDFARGQRVILLWPIEAEQTQPS
jgi:hypothetical protein